MFEMLTAKRCFSGSAVTEVHRNVAAKNMEQWPCDVPASEEALDFLHKLIEVDPLKRYSCRQALDHNWMARGDAPTPDAVF